MLETGGPGLVPFPATFDEYWELLEEAEYRADFYQNEIALKDIYLNIYY